MRNQMIWMQALRVVRLIVCLWAIALIASKGSSQFFGQPINLLMALISGFVSYRLVRFLYGRVSRGLIPPKTIPDEACFTIYTILTINLATPMLFAAIGIAVFSISRDGALPTLLKDYFTTALVWTALTLSAVAVFGELFNRIACVEAVQQRAIRFWNYMREGGNQND